MYFDGGTYTTNVLLWLDGNMVKNEKYEVHFLSYLDGTLDVGGLNTQEN